MTGQFDLPEDFAGFTIPITRCVYRTTCWKCEATVTPDKPCAHISMQIEDTGDHQYVHLFQSSGQASGRLRE